MKYISEMGGIWRVSERNYRKLIDDIKQGEIFPNLDEYGKMILADAHPLQDIIQEIEEEMRDDAQGTAMEGRMRYE